MNQYNEQQFDQDMNALRDDTPPMPENLHEAWMQRIAQEPQEAPVKRPAWRAQVTRIAAWAAAAVFIVTGATVTAGSLDPAASRPAEEMNDGMVMYSARSTSMGSGRSGYDGGTMLTSGAPAADMAAGETQTRKIIRSVSLTISAEDFPGTLSGLRDACETSGGWVETVSESGEAGHRRAWMTLRIPAGQLDTFVASAGGAGRVTNRSETTTDVSDSYYDTEARLRSQEALLQRLMELIPLAESLDDVLALEREIADVQLEIERLQGILMQTDRQVDYATVDITLIEETPADQAADAGLSLGERLQAALTTGAATFLTFLQDAAVWLVSALPFAAVAALIRIVVRLIIRKKKK